MAKTIWDSHRTVTGSLLAWNVLNILGGAALMVVMGRKANDQPPTDPQAMLRAVGGQAVAWGMINSGIALVGGAFTRRREKKADAHTPSVMHRETRNLRRLLWVNAGLDVLYMVGGLSMVGRARQLASSPATPEPGKQQIRPATLCGTGIGIGIQGMLLFLFDVVQALALPRNDRGVV